MIEIHKYLQVYFLFHASATNDTLNCRSTRNIIIVIYIQNNIISINLKLCIVNFLHYKNASNSIYGLNL